MKRWMRRGRIGRSPLGDRLANLRPDVVPTSLWFITLLVLLVPAQSVRAQAVDLGDPGRALTQYRIDGWQTEQGLPLNTVASLLQTSDGYLWVGTAGGLTRFDGVRFTTFETSDVPELASSAIFGLMEDSEGTLWIGHSDGAVIYRNGRFERLFGRELTEGRRVWAFAEATDGAIWIATGVGLLRWDGKVTHTFTEEEGLPTNQLRSIAFDTNGRLWIGTTGGGLVSWDGARFETVDESNGLPHDEVRCVISDRNGGVWASTAGGGLVHLTDGTMRIFSEEDGLPSDQLTSLALDADGSLWIGTWGAGLSRMREGAFTSISTDQGLAGEQVWAVHTDREGSIWVGTWVGGMNRLRDRDFLVLGTPEGLTHDNVRTVMHTSDGVAWVGTAGGGVNRIEDGRITSIGVENGLPSAEISSLLEDRDGTIWIGTYTGGVARLTNDRIDSFDMSDGLPSDDIRVLFRDRSGTLWAGTRWGLARFTGSGFSPVHGEGAPSDGVGSILQDREGTLWFGTAGHGLVKYRDGIFTTLTREDGLVSNWIMALFEDANGNLWIGTNGEGMNRIRNGEVSAIHPDDGLWDGVVQTLLEDRAGYLWITCNRGFFRVSLDELNAFCEGRLDRVSSDGYGPGNALRSTTFAGGQQPSGAVDADGNLWLPSFSGLVIVDPIRLPGTEGPPPVHLEEVMVNGERVPIDSAVVIPPGSAPLSIRYTAATLQNADRVRFRYRMDGTSGEWVDAGSNREAFFPALPHGDYRFRVAASADGQVWRDAPRQLAVTVQPYFFQTPWFIILIALAIIALTAAIFALWTRHLRRQQSHMERQVAEKTEELKLANEHLARLSFVDSLSGLANRRRFDEALDQEWRRASRFRTPIALVLADIDRFKEYNDALGHPEGDRCIVAVADVFRDLGRRAGDVVARYGGEEFVVLIPGAGQEAAMRFAEELRRECEARAIPHPTSDVAPVVTISLGVAACVPSAEKTSRSLLEEADAALYQAKHQGRNTVCCHEPVARGKQATRRESEPPQPPS